MNIRIRTASKINNWGGGVGRKTAMLLFGLGWGNLQKRGGEARTEVGDDGITELRRGAAYHTTEGRCGTHADLLVVDVSSDLGSF